MRQIPSLIFIQIFIYVLACLPFFSSIKYKKQILYVKSTQNYKKCVICLGLLFCIFATYDGDWYHYYDIIVSKTSAIENLENIHTWIIDNICGGVYLWWRLLIWGGIFIFYYLALKKINENNLITWSCLVIMTILQISTGRVYLGIAILFYGFCCLLPSNKKTKRSDFVKGICFISLSTLFHKSIFIYLIAAIFAFINFNTKFLLASLLAIPVIIKIFFSVLSIYIGDLEGTNSAVRYLEDETLDNGIGLKLYSYPFRFLIYILILLSYLAIQKFKNFTNYLSNKRIWQYCYNVLYIYMIVYGALTMNGIGSASISNRVFIGLYIPLPILTSKLIQNKYKTKFIIPILIVFFAISTYRLIYAYYTQKVGLH